MINCVVDLKHGSAEKAFIRNGTDIYICKKCGCILADVDFSKMQYDDTEYYTMSLFSKEDIENKWGLRWRYILKTMSQFVDTSKSLSLLDVGAGNGYFVSLALKEFGFLATGIGISKKENLFAKEVIGVKLLLEDITEHTKNYDIVTCFSVIEHVVDPHLFLTAMIKRLKPGGVLALATPNTSCLRARIKGYQKWERIDPPHHINLFPRKALDNLTTQYHLKEIYYETLSTYISFIKPSNLLLRKLFFITLKKFNLGADHFIIYKKGDN